MRGFFQKDDRDALSPLLEIARTKSAVELDAWLADLRSDAPCVVARIEVLLAEEQRGPVPERARRLTRLRRDASASVPMHPRPV
jgi:hypothetical protein